MKRTIFVLMAVFFAVGIILSSAHEARAMSSDTAAAMITVGAFLLAIPLIDSAVSDRRDHHYNHQVVVHKPYTRTYYNRHDYYSDHNYVGHRNEWRDGDRTGYRDHRNNRDSGNYYGRGWR